MEFIYEYGLFLAQAVTLVAAILILVTGLVALGQKQKAELHEGHIEIRNLNEKYEQMREQLQHVVTDPENLKTARKEEKKKAKQEKKAAKKSRKQEDSAAATRKRLYVMGFEGDIKASASDNLREEISAVLNQVEEGDEVLVKVESPGRVLTYPYETPSASSSPL